MHFLTTVLFLILFSSAFAQHQIQFDEDAELSDSLNSLIKRLNLDKEFDVGEDGTELISIAVVDLTSSEPRYAGVYPDNFIYPASFYKVYVAATILKQISEGEYSLDSTLTVHFPNVVDKSKEIRRDPRPLLQDGDTVTVNYLLDLMITRSDNSAANVLIDIADRKNINAIMHLYGWEGSEVTRKFLSRKYEDPGYKDIRGTEACARHAAEFFYLLYKDELVNHWVSRQLKALLARQPDKSKLSAGLPDNAMFYHKTGWWSYWTNDSGIIVTKDKQFIIACFLPLQESKAKSIFKQIANSVYSFL